MQVTILEMNINVNKIFYRYIEEIIRSYKNIFYYSTNKVVMIKMNFKNGKLTPLLFFKF